VPEPNEIDIAIVGAGAAGLMAAISAGREAQRRKSPLRIAAFDGARRIGAKILVAGGGRCNVTHHQVGEESYAGGSSNTIRKVLRRFDVEQTVDFFRNMGVKLKREETGKLFPVTDSARTILDALLKAAADAKAELRHPERINAVRRTDGGFLLEGDLGDVRCRRLILACGGKALPKSGSDGAGYAMAKALGHSVTPRVFPALVPLVLEKSCILRSLSGITLHTRIELRSGTGRRLKSFTNSTLCTHFGLSGPSVMDISRYFTAARFEDAEAGLFACWLPDEERSSVDVQLQSLGKRSIGRWLRELLPERLAEAVFETADVDSSTAGHQLGRDARRRFLDALFEMPLPVTSDRGFTHAEVTAGGIPLNEIKASSMASSRCEGLHLCGEICDVDGRIGGYNFQWAWASGHVAGIHTVDSLIG